MSYPSLLTKDSLEVILCFTLSSVTLTVQSPNSNAANWGWPKGRPSVTTDLNWSYASRHTPRASKGASCRVAKLQAAWSAVQARKTWERTCQVRALAKPKRESE